MQQQQPSTPTSAFCAAAPSESALLVEWERHLTPLVQVGLITFWSERHPMAGSPRTEQMHNHLELSDLLVLLLSADFLASDECIALMEHALRRHQDGKARLIPLQLRVELYEEILAPVSSIKPCFAFP